MPSFVKREFEAYLRCGILDYGFARVYCQECRYPDWYRFLASSVAFVAQSFSSDE